MMLKRMEETAAIADCAIAILAGGKSSRMGSDKAALIVDGETLLARTARIAHSLGAPVLVIGRAKPDGWTLPTHFLSDELPGIGPLGGIATALRATRTAVMMLACDMPGLSAAALMWLAARSTTSIAPEGVMGLDAQMRAHPLFAVYRPWFLHTVDDALRRGERSVLRVAMRAGVDRLPVPPLHERALLNCNTPADYERLRERPLSVPA